MTEGWLKNGLQGRHVLLGLVAFFGVMLVANGIFLFYALATFGGGDTSDPYRKGLHYNDVLAEAVTQDARGWRGDLAYDRAAGRLTVALRDSAGHELRGLHVEGAVGRPATDRQDVAANFDEMLPGVYAAAVRLAPGQWIVSVAADEPAAPGDAPYRLKRRLFVAVGP
jgi:nitrogen fixation protein FixH